MTKKKNKESQNGIIQVLETLIANEMTLFVKAKNYHWNVTGIHFKPLHELFDEIAESTQEVIDEVAERIRALGAFVPASLALFTSKTSLQEEQKTGINAEKMLENILKDYELIIGSLKEGIEVADDLDDTATEDMLTGFLREHEKTVWMLRSHLQ
jgi:starvation-inducible DNA-binding protein